MKQSKLVLRDKVPYILTDKVGDDSYRVQNISTTPDTKRKKVNVTK